MFLNLVFYMFSRKNLYDIPNNLVLMKTTLPKNFTPTLKLLSWSTMHVDYDQANKLLRWFPHNIQAIMAKIKLPKKPLSMVIVWIKVRRSYRELSSQADHARENWTQSYHSIFQLKRTFRVSWKHKNTRF